MKDEVKAALRRLFGEDEEGYDSFVESVDGTEREIEEGALVTRDEETPEAETETEVEAETETEEREIELDEDVVEALVGVTLDTGAIRGMADQISALTEVVTGLVAQVEEMAGETRTRLDALEAEENEKQAEWVADLPPAATNGVRVTYRRREQGDNEEEEPQTASEIAANNTSGLPTY